MLQKMRVSQNLSQIPGVSSSRVFLGGGPSRSLDFFFNAKEVSGSQKMYQSRRVAKSRIYHSTPLGCSENRLAKNKNKRFDPNKCDICSWDIMVDFH